MPPNRSSACPPPSAASLIRARSIASTIAASSRRFTKRSSMKTIFFDIDTQIDFVYPAGALYVPGAEQILPMIGELNRRAPLVISTMDAHAENDPEFQIYPHHCVVGTTGQHKPASTLLDQRDRQRILEKQTLDCFSSPQLAPLLTELNADRYVVYGVVTEICVRFAALGLLKT